MSRRFSEVLQEIGRPIAYYPRIAEVFGGATAALLLCQVFYWSERCGEDGWFWKTEAALREETGLTERELDGARAKLRGLGVLEERYARLEHRLHFRLVADRVDEIWAERPLAKAQNVLSGKDETYFGESAKRTFVTLSETTAETTPEKKVRVAAAAAPDHRVKDVMQALEGERGYVSEHHAAEAKAVKGLLAHNYTPDEILTCYRETKRLPFWADKGLTAMSLAGQIGEWKKNGGYHARANDYAGHGDRGRDQRSGYAGGVGASRRDSAAARAALAADAPSPFDAYCRD